MLNLTSFCDLSLVIYGTITKCSFHFIMPLPTDCPQKHCFLVVPLVCSSCQILLSLYLVNDLNSFDETDTEYSLAPNHYLIRFRRLKVKVTAGRQGHILLTPYLMK